jgi:hypothetical protein
MGDAVKGAAGPVLLLLLGVGVVFSLLQLASAR